MTAAPETLRPGLSRLYPSTPGAILEGLTIIVLAVVLIGTGVRYATAAGTNAQESAAKAQIAALAPVIDAYYLDHSSYRGMSSDTLRLTTTAPLPLSFSGLSDDAFCVQAQDGGWYAAQTGPREQIQTARQPLCP